MATCGTNRILTLSRYLRLIEGAAHHEPGLWPADSAMGRTSCASPIECPPASSSDCSSRSRGTRGDPPARRSRPARAQRRGRSCTRWRAGPRLRDGRERGPQSRLAQRRAAREIKALINDNAGQVAQGCRLVDQSGAILTEIVASVKKVTDSVSEIAAASAEHSAGIEQVNRAVTRGSRTFCLQGDDFRSLGVSRQWLAIEAAPRRRELANGLSRDVSL